jgi:altronate dehydratase
VVDLVLSAGEEVDNDVKALMMPPSRDAKSYRSMYAYGNHICIRRAGGGSVV